MQNNNEINKRKIGILGSTGSIGSIACNLISSTLNSQFSVEFLSCNANFSKISEQISQLNPKCVCVSETIFEKIKKKFSKIKVYVNINEMLLEHKTDVILHSISGISGISCILEAISSTKLLALANKESIVSAWKFIEEKSIEHGTQIIPVDSEHNSLYRLLEIIDSSSIANVSITASGGPFFGTKFNNLKNITLSQVMQHPTWNMGVKNTIDSATMANKVLELIEAINLFKIDENAIDVFINRQSIVHASVGLNSGGTISFSSKPNMQSHIGHAIMFPEYQEDYQTPFNGTLEFSEIKKDEFPIFFLGKEIIKNKNHSQFTIFNVANQVYIERFIQGSIKYTEILPLISNSLEKFPAEELSSIEELFNFIEKVKRSI